MAGERLTGTRKASDVIGMEVKNYQDERLGKVDDLLVDLEHGRVVEVVLSVGGTMGIGNTLVLAPPAILHYEDNTKILHLEADKDKLKNAPKFEASNWNTRSDTNQITELYRYYGQEPYYAMTLRTNDIARSPKDSDHPAITRMTPQATAPAYLERASKLIGASVKNLQNEKLGKVNNLMLGLSANRIVAVIVSSGGFLGMGDELSVVPPGAFRFEANRDALLLDVSKETLSAAPHFKSSQWANLNDPGYTAGVYHAYHQEPYFNTNQLADNSGRNVQDRDNRTLTPADQGNSQADTDVTRRIRKEVMSREMSVAAHNVKIITINGRVTLRGPVNTAEEKTTIEQIADGIAQAGNVDNQLEVKVGN